MEHSVSSSLWRVRELNETTLTKLQVIDYMKKKTWDEADFKKAMFSQEVDQSEPSVLSILMAVTQSKDDFAHISLLMSIRQNVCLLIACLRLSLRTAPAH